MLYCGEFDYKPKYSHNVITLSGFYCTTDLKLALLSLSMLCFQLRSYSVVIKDNK